jgi:DNA-binding response OmpR family regulator
MGRRRKLRVLLVDDEKKFVSVLATRLCMRGFDADYAFTGQEALGMAAESQYDVIVLDVKMPGIGGIDLKVKLQEHNPGARYIFVTGHGSADDYSIGSSEASFYLSKPLPIDDLIDAIRACARPEPDSEVE